jgi:hypothetical protein
MSTPMPPLPLPAPGRPSPASRAGGATGAPGASGASAFATALAGAAPGAGAAQVGSVGSPGGPHAPALLDALLDALRSERKLVADLATTMRRQRAAVAADDLGTVDDTVFAIHRLLATLGQARLRRRQVNRLVGGGDDIPLRELEAVVGPQMTDAMRTARDELAASATALQQEVDVNRRVLREAIATGEAHVRVLATGSAADPEGTSLQDADAGAGVAAIATAPRALPARATYGAGGAPVRAPRPAGGLLVNRTA